MLLVASLDAERAGETAQVETQVDCRAPLASSAGSQAWGSWSGIQWCPTGHAGARTQSGEEGIALRETFQMIGAHHTYGT